MPSGAVSGPSVWYGRDFQQRRDWIRTFDPAELAELDAAVRAINEAQIQNFLTKPIFPEALMQAVNAALVKGRAGLRAR